MAQIKAKCYNFYEKLSGRAGLQAYILCLAGSGPRFPKKRFRARLRACFFNYGPGSGLDILSNNGPGRA